MAKQKPKRQVAKADKPVCGAKLRNKNGRTCRRPPLSGATRCKLHGGGQQLEPKGGAQIKHGFYAKNFKDEEMKDDYFDASSVTGTLECELMQARSYLAWSMREQQDDPKGGIEISRTPKYDPTGDYVGDIIKIRPWFEVIQHWSDRVRSLEQARSRLKVEGRENEVQGALLELMAKIRSSEE